MLRGEYKGETFSAIFEAVSVKVDKERRGVGMQNFRYLPALKDLGYTIRMTSPSAYEILRKVIPMEHPRTIRCVVLFLTQLILTMNLLIVQLKASVKSFRLNRVNALTQWFATISTRSIMLDQLDLVATTQSYLPPSVHIGMLSRIPTMLLDVPARHFELQTSRSFNTISNTGRWRRQLRSGSIFAYPGLLKELIGL